MSIATRHSLLFLLLLAPGVQAQEGAPKPAAELQKLAPLVGNWSGSGTAAFGPGAPPVKWEAHATYRWCLDKFFLQEDFKITFEGVPAPFLERGIHGWDSERQSFVAVKVDNRGMARFDQTAMLADGTLLQFMEQKQVGTPFTERQRTRVVDGKLHFRVDLLMAEGASTQFLDGLLEPTDKVCDVAFTSPTFLGETPAEPMQKLARVAGVYDMHGSVVVAPGVPALKIAGTETFESAFGGTVLYGHSNGKAEGMTGSYHAEVFWAYDADRRTFINVFASNMGEIGVMDSRFTADGKTLISTAAGTRGGEPLVVRYTMNLDDKGAVVSGSCHSIQGLGAPAETFTATYKRR
ncbi:MAG: DUF1579 family protein [Planctomycetes bacterium]|nr:DUF1579 family protein [Planctomycetota bacterium]